MNFIYEPYQVSVKDEEGKVIILATFPKFNDHNVVVINHTYVDPSLRGQGVASVLMKETCEHIKTLGYKMVATCPYAVVWLKRHHEYDELIDQEEQTKLAPECQI